MLLSKEPTPVVIYTSGWTPPQVRRTSIATGATSTVVNFEVGLAEKISFAPDGYLYLGTGGGYVRRLHPTTGAVSTLATVTGNVYAVAADATYVWAGVAGSDYRIAQFISRDPITSITQQPYSYVSGNPLNETDPSGLTSFWDRMLTTGPANWDGWDEVGDFFAGWGDLATTVPFTDFSVTRSARGRLGPGGAVNSCSGYYKLGQVAGVTNVALIGVGAARGQEISLGRNVRLAPGGNRTGHPYGRYPHYHRRGPLDSRTGQTRAGQGIRRHRPWEPSRHDRYWWDRF